MSPELNNTNHWLFGISPEGIGTLGMIINLVIAVSVSRFTKAPPVEIREMVERIRVPRDLDKDEVKPPTRIGD